MFSLACIRLNLTAAGGQTTSLKCHCTVGLPQAPAHQPLSARGGSCPVWPVASSSWLARDSRARGDTAPPPPAAGVLRGGRGPSLRGGRSEGPAGTKGPESLLKQARGRACCRPPCDGADSREQCRYEVERLQPADTGEIRPSAAPVRRPSEGHSDAPATAPEYPSHWACVSALAWRLAVQLRQVVLAAHVDVILLHPAKQHSRLRFCEALPSTQHQGDAVCS